MVKLPFPCITSFSINTIVSRFNITTAHDKNSLSTKSKLDLPVSLDMFLYSKESVHIMRSEPSEVTAIFSEGSHRRKVVASLRNYPLLGMTFQTTHSCFFVCFFPTLSAINIPGLTFPFTPKSYCVCVC